MSEEEKIDARKTALQMATSLNPDKRDAQWGLSGIVIAPSIDKALTDADKVYEWIIKI